MYVTPTGADITGTWTYKLSTAYKTDVAADDVSIYDILGDLKEQGDYVAYIFDDYLDDGDDLYSYANIISIDNFSFEFTSDIIWINFDKVALVD